MIGKLVLKLLRLTGFSVVSLKEKELLRQSLLGRFWLENLFSEAASLSGKELTLLDSWLEGSQSQLGQDLVALATFGPERKGFFVEFGATNGKTLSNTWLLEKHFDWSGIVSEPAKRWKSSLESNRGCAKDFRCVYKTTGQFVEFFEAHVGEFSTISHFSSTDINVASRTKARSYLVETVSLFDLLIQYDAPEFIDFISIDTEGSEFEILENFEFSKFRFGLICVEHNYSPHRGKIKFLLEKHGYRQVLEEYSKFDDWYISAASLS